MSFRNPIVGGITLIRSAIKSPNYSAGSSGWTVNADGSAEFNDLTVRGTFRGTEFSVTEDGIFLYNGVPTHNNMVGSWTSANGTDEFGNAYRAGLSLYDGTTGTIADFLGGPDNIIYNIAGSEYVAMFAGNLFLNADGDPGGPNTFRGGAVSIIGDNSAITLNSPTNAYLGGGLDEDAVLWLSAGKSTASSGSVDYPHTFNDATDSWISGTNIKVIHDPVTGVYPTMETWHAPSPFSTNWAGTTTLNGQAGTKSIKYRKDTEDNVVITGAAVSTGTNTVIFVLPVGYRPAERQLIPCYYLIGTTPTPGFVQVTSAGQVACTAAISGVTVASGTQVYINGRVPLGNLT